MKPLSLLQSEKILVDVTGIEPATPCLQSRAGKTLTALSGVAYTNCLRDFRSSIVPKLSRTLRAHDYCKVRIADSVEPKANIFLPSRLGVGATALYRG